MNTFEKLRICFEELSKADPKLAYSDENYRMNLLKQFNRTFGFAYQQMAELLVRQGVEVDFDDSTAFFRVCAANSYIDDVAMWESMQNDRNMSLYIYNEKTTAETLVRVISQYIPAIGKFINLLQSHMG